MSVSALATISLIINVVACVANGIGVWRSKKAIARLRREAHRARLYGVRAQCLAAQVAVYEEAYRSFCEERGIKPSRSLSLH